MPDSSFFLGTLAQTFLQVDDDGGLEQELRLPKGVMAKSNRQGRHLAPKNKGLGHKARAHTRETAHK